MRQAFCALGLAALLLFAVGCAKSDNTAPGTEGEGGAIGQEGELGGTSTEDNITPAGGPTGEETDAQGAAIGEPAPAFESLSGTDDQPHSLKDYADAAVVAIVFTGNECPVAKAYEERLVELADDYKDKKVQVIAINSNNAEAEKLPAMKERAEEKGFNFPYLDDPTQETGRAYGATVTPHAYLLDQDRNVAYMGAIDDSQDASAVEQQHLRDAIDAVLAGEQPTVAKTQQFGCGIRYE
jgi:peroxiredoxin